VGSGNTELWVRDLDTGVETQLLVTGGRNLNCGAFYYTENAVPEPGTLRLLGLGLIAVGFGIRSRRRNRR